MSAYRLENHLQTMTLQQHQQQYRQYQFSNQLQPPQARQLLQQTVSNTSTSDSSNSDSGCTQSSQSSALKQDTRNNSPNGLTNSVTSSENSNKSDSEIELPNMYLSSNASSESRLIEDSKKMNKPIQMLQRLKIKVTKFTFPAVQAKLIYLPHEIEFEFEIGKDNTEFMAEGLTTTIQLKFSKADFHSESFLQDVSKLLQMTIYELCVIEVQQLLERQRQAREDLETKFKEEFDAVMQKSNMASTSKQKCMQRMYENSRRIPQQQQQQTGFNAPIPVPQRPTNLNYNRQLSMQSNGIFTPTSPILSPLEQAYALTVPSYYENPKSKQQQVPPRDFSFFEPTPYFTPTHTMRRMNSLPDKTRVLTAPHFRTQQPQQQQNPLPSSKQLRHASGEPGSLKFQTAPNFYQQPPKSLLN